MALKLNCVILDDNNNNRAFSVSISDQGTNVDDLKVAIKGKKSNAFRTIDADSLQLWKVSVPRQEVSESDICAPSLDPLKKLDGLFPDTLEREHVHIIVRPPVAGVSSTLFVSYNISTFLQRPPIHDRLFLS